jgi:hypothetical protein
MAGIRQHYIPRFLQAGFASRVEGDATFAWVFRRDRSAYEANSRHTGVERHFYTTGGDTSADDAITAAERGFSALVSQLKSCPPGSVVEPEITGFLCHLEIRTRHFRESFLAGTDHAITRLLERMSDEEAVIDLVLRRIAKDPVWFRKLFVEEFEKRGVPATQREAMLDQLMPVIAPRIPEILAALRPGFAAVIQGLKAQMPEAMKRAAKDGHINALKQAVIPHLRVGSLSHLSFRVVDVPSAGFILGDAAAIYRIDDARPFRAYTEKGNTIQAAFLPLSPSRILVGEPQVQQWDWALIRRQLARCSLEYFIAHENSAENQTLQKEIGIDAAILTDNELDAIVVECFENSAQPQPTPSQNINAS